MEIEEAVNKAIPDHVEGYEAKRSLLTSAIHKLIRKQASERMIKEVVDQFIPFVSCPIENGYANHRREMLTQRIRKILNPVYQIKVDGPSEFKH